MPRNDLAVVLRCLRSSGEGAAGKDLTDAELLERFRAQGEEAAFVVLVQRHGPMVMSVCRRLLASREDAEDAFQATFLLLATKAISIRKKGSLGSWLHGVARRAALNVRKSDFRRRVRERRSPDMTRCEPLDGPTWEELRLILDDELNRLPDKYRAPVVLCYLEGKTNEQAARELGCPKSSLSWRLGQARELLRRRLAQRGVTLPAAALAAVLMGQEATAALPALLVISTARAATCVFAKGATTAGVVSGRVLALVEGLSRTMVLNKCKVVLAVLLLAGLGGFGVIAATPQATLSETAEIRQKNASDFDSGPVRAKGILPPGPVRQQTDVKQEPAENPAAKQVNERLYLEMMRWVINDVDPAKGSISAVAALRGEADETREGLTLSGVPVAADAHILVNGAPGKFADLRPGMILSLRLVDGAPKITTVVAVKPKAALTSDVLESVDIAKRQVGVKLSEANTVVTLPVADDVDVVIDGKPAKLENLRGYSRVSVRLAPVDGRLVVKAIRAHVMESR